MEGKEGKPRFKKGFWKPEEDLILKNYVDTHGEGNWTVVSKKSGLMRGAKSCRLRWKNYLRPNIKRGIMSDDEKDLIIRLHKLLGNRWSLIAGRLPGRTDNEVKNYWNTHLNKKPSTPPPPPPLPAAAPPPQPQHTPTHQPQILTDSDHYCLHNLSIDNDDIIINQDYSPFFHNYDPAFFPVLDNLLLSTGSFECHVDEAAMHDTIFRQLNGI